MPCWIKEETVSGEGVLTSVKSGKIKSENLGHTEILDHDSKCSFGSLTKAKVILEQWKS